jgi:serine phosphatase RsbU (regulator of sigma subunit)
MSSADDWARRRKFWSTLPPASNAMFLAGVFSLFMSVGLLDDILSLGTDPPSRLVADMLLSGATAVAYILTVRRPRWLPVLIAVHVIVFSQFNRLLAPRTAPLGPQALHARLASDTGAVIGAIAIGFFLLSRVFQREGVRYVRAHTEIALASGIHRLLVPPVARRIGRFEFHGISLPSGDVGGDLLDVVASNGRWIGYVADVSGHGVGAGLLMGMAKSAARMQLLSPQPLDRLLSDLNVVLFDLKKPEMYVTFAGIQFDGGSELEFSVAGHLPILHYRWETRTIDELSMPQIPLAMFEGRSFAAARIRPDAGDLFVILTDGLTEVFDDWDREFSLERVKAVVREQAAKPLDRIQEILLAAVHSHGPQLDDQTMLLVRVLGHDRLKTPENV